MSSRAERTTGPVKVVKCNCGHSSCHTYGLSVGTFYQGCGFDRVDAQMFSAAPDMLAVLNDLEDSFDKQTYDERMRDELPDVPDEREYTVNITHKQWRALVAAVNKAETVS